MRPINICANFITRFHKREFIGTDFTIWNVETERLLWRKEYLIRRISIFKLNIHGSIVLKVIIDELNLTHILDKNRSSFASSIIVQEC